MKYVFLRRFGPFLPTLMGGLLAATSVLAQPSVTVRSPARNALSAPRPTNVALTFSQTMNAATDQNVRVFSAQRGGKKAGAYTTVGNTITFNPSTDFRPGEKVQVVVPPSVTSLGGQAAVKQVHEFWAATTGGSGSFTAAPFTATKGSYVDIGDVTGDGRPDIVSYHNGAGLVIVRPGNGAGSFGAAVNTVVSQVVSAGGLGDVDGDGDLDVMLTFYGNPSDYAQTFYNNGTGTFSPGSSVNLTSGPQVFHSEPVLGDIDGDGDLDMLCSNYGIAFKTDVRFNDGAGVFSTGPTFVSGQAFTTSLADMDNDGDLDVLQVDYDAQAYTMRRNNGNGAFGAPIVVGTFVGDYSQLEAADMNADGTPDLVISRAPNFNEPAWVEVRLNDGTGICTLASSQLSPYDVRSSLKVGDFDGDGDLDAVVAGGDQVQMMLNRGNGMLALGPISSLAGTGIDAFASLLVADLDSDNDLDIYALANSGSGPGAAIILNQAPITVTGVYPTRNFRAAPRAASEVVTFSANVLGSTANKVRVFGAQAGGKKAGAYSTATNTITFNPTTDFRPGEAVSVSIPRTVKSTTGAPVKPHVYQFTGAATGGSGTFVSAPNVPLDDQPFDATLADVNGDGHLDLLASTFLSDVINIRLGDGTGHFNSGGSLPSMNNSDLVMADLDGNGILDLLSLSSEGPRYRLGMAFGLFGPPVTIGANPNLLGIDLAVADVDGDGNLDVLVSGGGGVNILYHDADGLAFTNTAVVSIPTGSRSIACADVDADGDLDLFVVNTFDDAVSVHRNNGSGGFGPGVAVAVGDFPEALVVNDIDGDGDVDFAVGNIGGSSVSIGRNNGSGTFTVIATLATSVPRYLALTDIDGDADLDLLTTSGTGTGVWRNNGIGTFTAGTSADSFGESLAYGDLDEDGDVDMVIVDSNADLARVRLNQDAFQVTAVSPTRNDADAPRAANVGITFAQGVNIGTRDRIRIWGQQRGGKKAGVYSSQGTTVTFNPTTNFAPGELVNVTVPGTVVSTGGALARKHVYQFRAAATGGQATFTAAPDVPAGGPAQAVTTADVNADGNLDLLQFHVSTNEVWLHLGNGDGTFGAGVVVSSPTAVVDALTTADLDNDGDLDLLVGDRIANKILVHLNAGGGTFGPPALVSTTGLPYKIVAGDIDGDGDLDLVTSGGNGTIRFNNGSGGFSGGGVAGIPGALTLALGDLDGDGDLDAISGSTDKALIRFNNGSGVFSGGYALNVGTDMIVANANEALLGDLDGDGDLDLAMANEGENFVAIRLNDGTGQLSGTLNIPVSSQAFEAAMGDVDGDGDLDIIVADGGGDNTSSVLLNNGDATFALGTPISTPDGFGLVLGDVDNDGDLDLLISNAAGNAVSVRLNENAFTVTARAPERHTSTAPTFSDVNLTLSEAINPLTASQLRVFGSQSSGRKGGVFAGSGTSLSLTPNVAFAPGEVVSVTARATIKTVGNVKSLRPHVYEFRAKATGGTGAFVAAPDANLGPLPGRSVAADVNGDGYLDLLAPNYNIPTASVALGAGDGTFGPASTVALGGDPFGLLTADIDGDGDLDLISHNPDADALSIRRNNGAGVFSGADEVAVGDHPMRVRAGDLDGDGDLDLVTGDFSGHSLSICLNNGTGTFGLSATLPVATYVSDVQIGDVDNDGRLDLVASIGSSTAVVLRNTGAATFAPPVPLVTPAYYAFIDLADLDGDGDLDLVLPGGNSQLLHVLRNDGNGAFGALVTIPMGLPVYDALPADFDGDGDLDLVVTTSIDEVIVRLNNGMGGFGAVPNVAINSTNGLTAGDLDGDGDIDLMGSQTSSNLVNIRLNGAVAGPAPTILSFTPDHGVTGTVVTLTGTNFTGTTAVTFDGVAAPGFVVNGAGTEITVASPPATFNGVITVTTPDGDASTATDFGVDLVISGVETIPAGDFHHITVTATGVATLGGAVEATSDVLVQTGGELADGSNALSGSGSFTLEPGATLRLRNPQGLNPTGALQLTGGLTLDVGATYVYQAALAQVTGSNLPAEVRNLTLDNAVGVSLTQPVNIRQVLTVAGAGNFSLNGQPLTLLSDAAGTALLVNAGAGRVVGAATAQVWMNPAFYAGASYRHVSAPTTNSTVADLATVGFTPVLNAGYNELGYPVTIQPFPNVYGFDEARYPASAVFEAGYFSLPIAAAPLVPTKGYSVFMAAGLTPDFRGTFTQDGVSYPGMTRTGAFGGNTEKSGWHLVGNPYPSPIDWDLITPPVGLSPSISVFRATGPNNAGLYLTRANGMGSLPGGVLPMGQAFFARVLTGAPLALPFTNACRVTTFGSPGHYRAAPDPRPVVALTLRAAHAPAAETDGATVYFQSGATPGLDRDFDGERPAHNVGLPTIVSLTAAAEELAVNGLPETALAEGAAPVELLLDLPAIGTYELAVAQVANLPADALASAVLLDRLTHTRYPLADQPTVRVTAAQAGAVRGRFALVFGRAAATATALNLTLYPNPAPHGAAVLVGGTPDGGPVRVFDATGRLVQTHAAPATPDAPLTVKALTPGVYVVRQGARIARLVVE